MLATLPNGFARRLRNRAAKEPDHRCEVIEAVLAYVVRDKVEAAYACGTMFKRQRRLMDDWAAYLASESREP